MRLLFSANDRGRPGAHNGAHGPTNGTAVAIADTTLVRLPSQSVHKNDRAAGAANGNGNGNGRYAPRVSVVIPTLNEARNLPHVLPRLPESVYEVVLVDGRSTDGTVDVARALIPDVRVVSQSGRGKGNALICGFAAATGDIIVMLDADGSARPEEIPDFVDALVHGADMAKGSRFARGGGSADITRLRSLGNRLIGLLVNLLYDVRFTDLCYGYNAFWKRALTRLRIDCVGFEVETLINVRAAKAGLHIVEVPSYEDPRIHGASNLHAFRDGWRIVRLILRERFRRAWPPLEAALGPVGARAGLPRARPATSVVICTYSDDRWHDLVCSVASLSRQTLPPLETIVVVDHNERLLERVRAVLPDVVAVANVEARGLSGARNSGIAAAGGDVIAFLDDDAVASVDWLEQLADAYDDARVLGVGGVAEPAWDSGRPSRFPPEFDWVVGCTYRGMPLERAHVRNLIGANMSFRREVLEAAGGFRSGIGRVGTRPAGCEETELCIRAQHLRQDGVFVFEPQARVSHRVPPQRATWRYFGSRCFAEGQSKATVARLVGARDALATERAYAARTLSPAVARALADCIVRGDAGGLGRAAAVVAGAACTAAGYGTGVAAALLETVGRP